MNKLNSRTISINALAIALVCLSTMFLQFPIPLGYAHLGNCFILISGVFFGPVTGLLAGGIGSALSDLLTGYAQWIIPTLIIKGKKTINDVPAKIRDQVVQVLVDLDVPELAGEYAPKAE